MAEISAHKNEPEDAEVRLKSLEYFRARPMPGYLSDIDFENIYYYIKPTEMQAKSWDDLPSDIKQTWDRLGIPEAEKKYPRRRRRAVRVGEVAHYKLQEELVRQGVIFLDMDSGLREQEELVREYFGTVIPQNDNKFAALNSAVWSGGSFIYVPPAFGSRCRLQAYFRINAENMGQFERTLHHRRRGRLRALRRGLHPDLLDRLAALGCRRDHRQEGWPLPLHDDSELVDERVQPRHEVGCRQRGRDDGVGRRQPWLEGDDEVPGHLAHG